jgi:hypothetical protein
MKVGDLVRFRDISSPDIETGKRMFPEVDGQVGLVLKVHTDRRSGNRMVFTDLERNGRIHRPIGRGFNAMYFEVLNESR